MSQTLERFQSHWRIRLEGETAVASAAELKALLTEWIAAGKDLELDLERVEEIDLTAMQLFWAAGCEAARRGVEIRCRQSAKAAAALNGAGFVAMPGFTASPAGDPGAGDSGVTDA